jgi:hypothetical protein
MNLKDKALRSLNGANRNEEFIRKSLEKLNIELVVRFRCMKCEQEFSNYSPAIVHAKTCTD